jgi:hypothetical protein
MKTTANNSNKEQQQQGGEKMPFVTALTGALFFLLAGSTIHTTPGAVDTAAPAPKASWFMMSGQESIEKEYEDDPHTFLFY